MLNNQQMEEQFKTLIVLSHYLETARFRQFWEEAVKNRHILKVVPGTKSKVVFLYSLASWELTPLLTLYSVCVCV
ncbi:Eukaryotic translation initiation factor 3 subunit K [Platanthera zijinensis]|uniref:Eukaryotic translation initiation factor 3 subunit K n=1 Tax=Platanthera zijinensis TaxID=2320716 RepID=A0AAP0BB00_9ASPA